MEKGWEVKENKMCRRFKIETKRLEQRKKERKYFKTVISGLLLSFFSERKKERKKERWKKERKKDRKKEGIFLEEVCFKTETFLKMFIFSSLIYKITHSDWQAEDQKGNSENLRSATLSFKTVFSF